MIKTLHIAVQYLAAAGISFVEKKPDDSHTNLGWSPDSSFLYTRNLNDAGLRLRLNYPAFALEWSNGLSLPLNGINHAKVVEWISNNARSLGVSKKYRYRFHYETGYGPINDDFIHQQPDESELHRISDLLSTAQLSIGNALRLHNLQSEIRIWPHHFDLGAYARVNEQLGIGIGLAIPDSMINNFYYYVSGWRGDEGLQTDKLETLSHGEWRSGSWNGATLEAMEVNESKATDFIVQAIAAFRSDSGV